MKITNEMVDLMGGSETSKEFKWFKASTLIKRSFKVIQGHPRSFKVIRVHSKFKDLCIKAYLSVRPYQESIVSLVALMLGTGLPCFLGHTIKQLRARFAPTMTEKQAAAHLNEGNCLDYCLVFYSVWITVWFLILSRLLSGIWYCLDYILVIGKSYLSKWSHTYDMIQYKQQGKQTNKQTQGSFKVI